MVLCLKQKPGVGKFESLSRKGIFLGHSDTAKAYRIWFPDVKQVEITRDVKFVEGFSNGKKQDLEDFSPEYEKLLRMIEIGLEPEKPNGKPS